MSTKVMACLVFGVIPLTAAQVFRLTRALPATQSPVIASEAKQSHPQKDCFILRLLCFARNDEMFCFCHVSFLVFYRSYGSISCYASSGLCPEEAASSAQLSLYYVTGSAGILPAGDIYAPKRPAGCQRSQYFRLIITFQRNGLKRLLGRYFRGIY